jgi:dolichol kinase
LSSEILAALVILLIFFLLLFLTSYLYNHFKWQAENSRKFLHVSGGLLALTAFRFIESPWLILILCGGAFLILLATFLKKMMPAVHETKRISFGSILFPVPIYICFVASKYLNNEADFYLPIALMTISDSVAEWGGKKWGPYSRSFFRGQKTLAGSLSFAVSSFIICFFLLLIFNSFSYLQLVGYSLLLTLAATLAELVTLKGFDNLTVPLVTLIVLYFLR